MAERKPEWSQLTVIWMDGEVTTHIINAGLGVADYLTRQAASGFVSLRNGEEATTLNTAHIRTWTMEKYFPPSQPPTPSATEGLTYGEPVGIDDDVPF